MLQVASFSPCVLFVCAYSQGRRRLTYRLTQALWWTSPTPSVNKTKSSSPSTPRWALFWVSKSMQQDRLGTSLSVWQVDDTLCSTCKCQYMNYCSMSSTWSGVKTKYCTQRWFCINLPMYELLAHSLGVWYWCFGSVLSRLRWRHSRRQTSRQWESMKSLSGSTIALWRMKTTLASLWAITFSMRKFSQTPHLQYFRRSFCSSLSLPRSLPHLPDLTLMSRDTS